MRYLVNKLRRALREGLTYVNVHTDSNLVEKSANKLNRTIST